MAEFDVKLLRVFDEVYKTRSVSRAAEHLGLAQPSVSIALAKLRRHFKDPLFVRTSSGMEATPHAGALVGPVREALRLLEMTLGQQAAFDPARSDRTFRIAMTDISQSVLLPTLLNHLKTAAPSIRIDVLEITAHTPRSLEAGDADLAIGFMPQIEAGFYQQKLFAQRLVCICRKDHPRIRGKLDRRQFAAEAHVAVAASGTGHWTVEKALQDRRIERRVALRLPNFLGLGRIVARTDLVATVPSLLAETLATQDPIQVLALPVEMPAYAVKQHWHERYHHDPGHAWLRREVATLFRD